MGCLGAAVEEVRGLQDMRNVVLGQVFGLGLLQILLLNFMTH